MVTEVRELQKPKAYFPIVVTLLGMVTEVRALQSLKASPPIVVTPSPIVTLLIECPHGAGPHGVVYEKSYISPFPEMVKTPSSVRCHFRLGPQVPELSALADKPMSRAINKM